MSEVKHARPSIFKQELMVDPKVQKAILYYAALLAFVSLSSGITLGFTTQSVWQASEITFSWILVSAAIAIWIMSFALLGVLGVLISHRIAGPVFRLRKHMQEVASGGAVTPVSFRKGDHFLDVAADYNRVLERLQNAENKSK